jgi:hypothetical protein
VKTRGRQLVRLTYPDGKQVVIRSTARGVAIKRRILLKPGPNPVAVSVAGAGIHAPWDARSLYMLLLDPVFVESPRL